MVERYIAKYMEDNHIPENKAVGDLVNQMAFSIPVNDGNEIVSYVYNYNPDDGVMEEKVNYITGLRTPWSTVLKITSEEAKQIRQKYNVW